ncbi:T9SS type A sorting domain-containing protein [Dysgonomonas sp. 520]|uniref:T9SS type A sorting domain-containing protein n=1 Tax=Dysgonomonas sp. 520 TaxID=2302931 RepID=UPI0013CF989E|nr:T9SS type A sorting domain-containing protein [Dysgonomonas sp. 520]
MKKLFTFFAVCLMASSISAQNFTKFNATDNAGVKILNDFSTRPGAGQLDIIVPENFDVTNVILDCAVGSNDEIVTSPLPTNFSSPQTIITKITATGVTRTWNVTFRKLKPSTLPLDLTFSAGFMTNSWDANTVGWAGAAFDPADNNSKIVRFANTSAAFITAFSDAPGKVSFTMTANGVYGEGIFDVFSSEDGINWKSEMQFNSEKPITNTATSYDFTPSSNVRYVKWVYTKRVQTVSMNNISIEKGVSTIIEESTLDANVYVNGNELMVGAEVNKVEVYNVTGSQVLAASNPSTSIDLSGLAKGIYVAKVTADNKAKTLKFIIK